MASMASRGPRADDGGDDGLGEAGSSMSLPKMRAQQEDREVELEEAGQFVHEHAGEEGRDRGRVVSDGEQGGDRREEDDAEAAVGDGHGINARRVMTTSMGGAPAAKRAHLWCTRQVARRKGAKAAYGMMSGLASSWPSPT